VYKRQGYKFAKFFLGKILDSVKLFCAQTELDAVRIKGLGVAAEKVVVTGNLKFDVRAKNPRFHLSALGFKDTDLLLVAGSTHEGEEEIIIKIYKNLSKEFPSLKLLLAPRHIERCEAIEKVSDREKIDHARFSHVIKERWEVSVITLDTIGDLSSLYGLADVVFMGGSLVKKGGHNIIEPAMFGKAVVFGPFMFNFKDIVEIFLNRGAAIRINNPEELRDILRKLLLEKGLRESIGSKAKEIVEENKGAAEKTALLIEKNFS
jgi:3-deoxy-D-manno-octulosonic-acid transferase